MRIAVIVGTRPEVIKMAPVIYQLRKRPDFFEVAVIATAQHRELLDQALVPFRIVPDIDLNLMSPGQCLSGLASRALERMDATLENLGPDMVLVQGDTTTVFAAALAAFHRNIPVTHIEAGLRSHDLQNPFPEEANRRLTSVLAEINCAPTALARSELLKEGIDPRKIVVTGNTVVDALHEMLRRPFSPEGTQLAAFDFVNWRIVLVTCHRRESWGKNLEEIFLALTDLIKEFPDVHIIFPVHLNPRIRDAANKMLVNIDRIHLVPPLDYLTFINLMKESRLILTDSGGLQEEAPTLGKPLLVLRGVTERPEAFIGGSLKVVGTTREAIVQEASRLLNTTHTADIATCADNPYGDGKAAVRIVEALERWSHGQLPLLEPDREFSFQNGNSTS
jgi:UDP-N-acetylglucosamine 2-epimerase (non-hydrolysing)